jgi:tetratricopeptide (TPR) repeat protein
MATFKNQYVVHRIDTKFVIVVAPFWGINEAATREGKVMQSLIEQKINEVLDDQDDLLIIGKERVKVIRSHDEARDLGKSLGAYVVFWGEVISLGGDIEFQPFVTITEIDRQRYTLDPVVLAVGLDNPQPIAMRKNKIEELKNHILYTAAEYYFHKERLLSYKDKTLIQKSIDLCQQISPPSQEGLYLLGANYVQLNELKHAKSAFEQIIVLNHEYDRAWISLGSVYLFMNDFDKAIQHCKKAIELKPEISGYHNYLGAAYRHLQQFDLATKEYHKAIELDPDNERHLFGLGIVYFDQENFRDATIFYEKAINKGYRVNGDELYILGTAYHFGGNYDKALENYFKIFEQDSSYHWAWANHNIGLI